MEKIVEELIQEIGNFQWQKINLTILFYEGFVKCHIDVDDNKSDLGIKMDLMIKIYNYIKNKINIQNSSIVNKANLIILKNSSYNIELGFDKEFATEHLKL